MSSANGYGTIPQHRRDQNGTLDAGDQERAALLGKPDDEGSTFTRLHRHMNVNVSKKWGDIALLSCYVITGLLDSSSVFIWGSFLSMQTG